MSKKFFIALLLISLAASSAPFTDVISHHQKIVDEVNSSNLGWTASIKFVSDKSFDYLNKLASTTIEGLD